MAQLELSPIERDTLISWRGDSAIALPNEEQLICNLRKHTGGVIALTDNQVVILSSWAEAEVDKNFGAGAITNIIEMSLLKKIKKAYSLIP